MGKLGIGMGSQQGRFKAFRSTEKRRRLMKQEWDAKVAELTEKIIDTLSGITKTEVPQNDPEMKKTYETLRDTFNAFDNDGSAELAFPEYKDAWKFLGRSGSDLEIRQTFDSVDVDGSGYIEMSEFLFSLMGEDALKFGTMANLEVMQSMLAEVGGLIGNMKGDLENASMSVEDRKTRNKMLKDRLKEMKKEM